MPSNTALNDAIIVETVLTQPERGFRLLMQRFKEPVYWHIRRLVVNHDDAQDASQETFIRVFRGMHRLNDGTTLAAWIYRIATNEAFRLINRRREAASGDMDELLAENAPMQADCYVDYADLEAVRLQKAISALPAKQRIVFTLRYYDEMAYDEIAQVADCTPNAAKSNYHIAKASIIKYMTHHD